MSGRVIDCIFILVEYTYEGYVIDFHLVQFPELVYDAMEIYVKVSDQDCRSSKYSKTCI